MKCDIWNCNKVALPNLLSFIVDNRGKTVPTEKDGHILIATNCIRNEDLYPKYSNVRFLSEKTYQTWFRAHPIPGDILFVCKGTPGRVCMVPDPIDFCIAQDMVALRVNKEIIYDKYLLAVLRSRKIQMQIEKTSVGDVIPHFKKSFFDQLLIPIPEMKIQKIIGDYYFAFSNKIELNNAINNNLEEQAQALFKSWFVDFEPFGGVIPEGWEEKTIGELCESVSITRNKTQKEMIFLNTGDIDNGRFLHNNFSEVANMPGQAKKTIKKDDILYSEIRPVNRHFAYVSFDANDYVVSTKLMVIRCKEGLSRRIYHYLTLQSVIDELQIEAETRSGTFPQIRFENIKNIKIILADANTENKFKHFIEQIYLKMECNINENNNLSTLRDTLLPKLMSGEIDVSEIDI